MSKTSARARGRRKAPTRSTVPALSRGQPVRLTPREVTERWERERLRPYAALAAGSRGRRTPEDEDPLRTCFQRDRDRIVHSKSFRRLKHKTQVFVAPPGDHYRTRLSHSLEVSQVARTVARALQVNEDLTEAIALAHDLGHPPFGHAGEAALNGLMGPVGGFRHFEQSLRIVEVLEQRLRADGTVEDGLNLTWEVRDGISSHSKGLRDLEPLSSRSLADARAEGLPATVEAQIVRFADRIAYVHHDMDDAVRAGVVSEGDVPAGVATVLGTHRGEWIGRMVSDLVAASWDQPVIQQTEPVRAALNTLKDFLAQHVYLRTEAMVEVRKAQHLLRELFAYYLDHLDDVPSEYQAFVARGEPPARVVGDFLAGMTDRYAIRVAEGLLIPRMWNV